MRVKFRLNFSSLSSSFDRGFTLHYSSRYGERRLPSNSNILEIRFFPNSQPLISAALEQGPHPNPGSNRLCGAYSNNYGTVLRSIAKRDATLLSTKKRDESNSHNSDCIASLRSKRFATIIAGICWIFCARPNSRAVKIKKPSEYPYLSTRNAFFAGYCIAFRLCWCTGSIYFKCSLSSQVGVRRLRRRAPVDHTITTSTEKTNR